MRIGFQIEHFDRLRGGAETYVFRFASRLIAEAHDVHVFCRDSADVPSGLFLHRVKPYRPKTVWSALRSVGLDVVVGSGKSLGMNVFQPHGGTVVGTFRQNIALIQNSSLRRVVTTLNQINPKYVAATRLEREQYSQDDPPPHFVALSHMVREDMRTFYNVPDDRLHLVYNGVEIDEFSPAHCAEHREETRRKWHLSPTTVCFLLVAHNFRLKGVRELIDAVALVRPRHRDFRLVVVGRGNPQPFLFRCWRRGCHDIVQFVGAMRDIGRAYAAADAYVHPTWYDPCSLTVLEAWACGLPVITTRFNGAGELMTEGEQGFLIDTPANTEALAARMIDLLDRDRRHRMGRSARSLAECHTAETNFRKMTEIMELSTDSIKV